MSGQHNYTDNPYYFDGVIQGLTGKYPGLWGNDFAWNEVASLRQDMVDAAIDHWEDGNIVTLSWHASMPDAASDAGWDSVQGWYSDEDIEDVVTPGTTLYNEWQASVDNIAGYLQDLEDADVPVLWRPFHEMNGGWFWWGGRPDIAKQLWIDMYDRLVNYHHLDNLIWVWSPGAMDGMNLDDYYPGDEYVDMAALDIYDGFKQSYYDALVDVADGKPIAIGECGELPDMASLVSNQPLYVYFMGWGNNVQAENTTAEIQAVYSHSYTLTRDEIAIGSGSSGGQLSIDDAATGTGQNEFEFSGTWNTSTGAGRYQNGDHYSWTTGDYYQVRFNGTQAVLYGEKDAHHGIAAVSIDGGAEVNVDLYAASRVDSTPVWTSPTLSAGNHTLKVRVSGAKNAASTGYVVVADRVDVSTDTQEPTAPTGLTSTSQTTSSIVLSWNASTDNVGVAGYDVYMDGAFAGTASGTTYTASGLTSGTSHSFAVKAKDGAGNVSAASNTTTASTLSSGTDTIVNDATTGTGLNQFEFVGSWSTSTGAGKYNSDDHYSANAGDYYQVRFNGTQIKLYAGTNIHHGIAAVSIDGGAETNVDFYASAESDNTLLWTSPTLSSGNHTLKVRVTGTKNASSSWTVITADRVVVTQPASTVVNDAVTGTGLNQFEYSGSWSAGSDAANYNGDDHYSAATGDYYQVRFNGTQIKLYAAKDAHHGIAAVSIDGGAETNVDFYASSRMSNTLLWSSPVLSAGNHTLKVRVTGTKNASSTWTVVTADRVEITS